MNEPRPIQQRAWWERVLITDGDVTKEQLVCEGRGMLLIQHDGTPEGEAAARLANAAQAMHETLLFLHDYFPRLGLLIPPCVSLTLHEARKRAPWDSDYRQWRDSCWLIRQQPEKEVDRAD